jgi:predicted dithiol-disulfide oxidoreductase (DUF899 family)
MDKNQSADHKVVSRAEWLGARKELLAKEKEFTRQRDAVSAARRALPWVKVEKEYSFDTPSGKETLAKLFDGRSQLIVYHFMLGPDWKEGCPSCSLLAEHFDGPAIHLAQRDVTFIVVSRAPLAQIEAFKKRMGWHFQWASSFGSEFNFDCGVSFAEDQRAAGKNYNFGTIEFREEEGPGLSVFSKNGAGEVFHTYSSYARGLEDFMGVYRFLDVVPKGRNEEGLRHGMAWVRHHDKYADGRLVNLK